jgi:hypothetical protein
LIEVVAVVAVAEFPEQARAFEAVIAVEEEAAEEAKVAVSAFPDKLPMKLPPIDRTPFPFVNVISLVAVILISLSEVKEMLSPCKYSFGCCMLVISYISIFFFSLLKRLKGTKNFQKISIYTFYVEKQLLNFLH